MNKTVILVDNRDSYGVSKTYKKGDKFQAISETANGYTIKTSEGNFTFGKHRFIDDTPEAILAYCQEQYPIGTKINCVLGWTNQKNSNETGIIRNEVSINSINRVWSQDSYYNICIYDTNKGFAKIIFKPEVLTPKIQEPVDTFVLPERWHVVVTEENHAVLAKWRGVSNTKYLPINDICGVCHSNGDKGHNPIGIIKDKYYNFGVEITYEQFLKYVLKDNTTKPTITETTVDKQISLKSIKEALLKEYDKTDVEDIMKVIDKIK